MSFDNDGILDESDRSFLNKVLDDINDGSEKRIQKKEESFHSRMFKKKFLNKKLNLDMERYRSSKEKNKEDSRSSKNYGEFKTNAKSHKLNKSKKGKGIKNKARGVGHNSSKSNWNKSQKGRKADKDEYSMKKQAKDPNKFEEQNFLLYKERKSSNVRPSLNQEIRYEKKDYFKKRGSLIVKAETTGRRKSKVNTQIAQKNQLFDLRKLWTTDEINGKRKRKETKDSADFSPDETMISDDDSDLEEDFRKRKISHFGKSHKKKDNSIGKKRKSKQIVRNKKKTVKVKEESTRKKRIYSIDSESEDGSAGSESNPLIYIFGW